MVDIKGLNKAAVLAALYNGTRSVGMGVLHDLGRDMSIDEAQEIIDQQMRISGRLTFDYVAGRPLKVDIAIDEFDPRIYDRDAGKGAAQRAIDALVERLTAPKK